MLNIKLNCLSLSVFFMFSGAVTALEIRHLEVDRAQSEFQFKAIGKPSFIKIKGGSSDFQGQLTIDNESQTASGQVELSLSTLQTGIELRDQHLRENYLQVAQYPTALLRFQSVPVNAKNFKAQLTLHGISKEVDIELAEPVNLASKPSVQAQFSILLEDFGIEIPSFKGITVASKVDLEVRLALNEKSLSSSTAGSQQ